MPASKAGSWSLASRVASCSAIGDGSIVLAVIAGTRSLQDAVIIIPAGSTPWDSGELCDKALRLMLATLAVGGGARWRA